MKKIRNLFLLVTILFGMLLSDSCKKDKSLAVLTTTGVTGTTFNSATSGGNITSSGGADITARGVCWSTSRNPVVSGLHTTDGTGTGIFSSSLTGLTENTPYYVRAYATNSVGTAYGNEVSFSTNEIVVPTLTTTAATEILLTTATTGGNISTDGGASVTDRGVCWGTTADPDILGSKVSSGTGTGIFTTNLTGLTPATQYHIRAYATNSIGTAYGADLTFTTASVIAPTLTTVAISATTRTSAVSGGVITADGGANVTERGVCWSTETAPDINDAKTSDGTGIGTFSSSITGLTAGTTYYVRAYATNSAGTSYGNELTFESVAVSLATLTTADYSLLTQTTATSGGEVTTDGGSAVTARGIVYAMTTGPTIATGTVVTTGAGLGAFVSNMTGLTAGTQYYVRAYATNSAGTEYGNEITFTTDPVVVPVLTTAEATALTRTTATTGGNVTSDGGATVTARGVCYALTANPDLSNTVVTSGSGSGVFASNLTGLTPGTLYHVRAYATNSTGTGYGPDIDFTTNPIEAPIVTTAAVSPIALTTATSGGNVTSDGGGTVTARGIVYSTSPNPSLSNSVVTTGSGTGSYSSNLTALAQGTLYYVSAYATNSAGTSYGNQVLFNTNVADIEGNTYRTVTIGSQVWMAENLKTATLDNGTPIVNVTDNAAWIALSTPAYCWYNNDMSTYKPLYGALYNYFVVNTGDLCMSGWHAPLDEDFKTLETTLGLSAVQLDNWGWRGTDQGAQLKNTTGWVVGENGTNTSGFSALPGGYRYAATGTFNDIGNLTYFWSRTELDATRSWYRLLDGSNSDIYRAATVQAAGKYVRCVKD